MSRTEKESPGFSRGEERQWHEAVSDAALILERVLDLQPVPGWDDEDDYRDKAA